MNILTDRELLELAAKAAGYKSFKWVKGFEHIGLRIYGLGAPFIWFNPLADDGDAFRLAVKLCIDIGFGVDATGGFVAALVDGKPTYSDNCKDDPYAATRRAIVRAAAEIGKDMK